MENAQIGLDKLFEVHIYTVSELTREVRDLLEENFADLWVMGEISNLRIPTSGHIYLTLKDETSQIRAVIFKSQRDFIPFTPQDGLGVLAKGRISVYEPRGEYQLLVDYMEPKGKGALQLAFEQLKEKLYKEGLFDERHKKALPLLPQRIGVVTSPTGAAIRDILMVIDRRFANVHITLYPVRVQGEGAAAEIAQAIDELNAIGDFDVIIVGRGGGSLEDLWAFNEEVVARAIFRSKIPIISAVGHEIDYTIADFVADLRAPTPSAAAERVVRSKEELIQHLDGIQKRIASVMKSRLSLVKAAIGQYARSRAFAMPKARVYNMQQRVDDLSLRIGKAMASAFKASKMRIEAADKRLALLRPTASIEKIGKAASNLRAKAEGIMAHRLQIERERLGGLIGKLDSLNPLSILSRGYSICRRLPGMELIKTYEALAPGECVNLKLWRGEAICGVQEVLPEK